MKIMNTAMKKIVMGVVLVGFGMSYAEESGYFASFVRNMRGALDFVSPSDFESTMQEPAANGTFWMKKFLKRVAHGIGGVVDATFKPKFVEKVVTESVAEPTVTSFPVETIVPTVSPSLALNDSRVVEEPSFMWNAMTSKPVLVGAGIAASIYGYFNYMLNKREEKIRETEAMIEEINALLDFNSDKNLDIDLGKAVKEWKYVPTPSKQLLETIAFRAQGEQKFPYYYEENLNLFPQLEKSFEEHLGTKGIKNEFIGENFERNIRNYLVDLLVKIEEEAKVLDGIISKFNASIEAKIIGYSSDDEDPADLIREPNIDIKKKIRKLIFGIINQSFTLSQWNSLENRNKSAAVSKDDVDISSKQNKESNNKSDTSITKWLGSTGNIFASYARSAAFKTWSILCQKKRASELAEKEAELHSKMQYLFVDVLKRCLRLTILEEFVRNRKHNVIKRQNSTEKKPTTSNSMFVLPKK